MRILSVDTSTAACSIVLSVDGKVEGELNVDSEGTHSVRLLPGIDAILRWCACKISDVDVFGVVTGPGSFTGVRIGLTTVKALAESLAKPAIAVTAFEAWIEKFPETQGTLVPLIDARRGEVYGAVFRRQGEAIEPVSPGRVDNVAELLASITEPQVSFIGGGSVVCEPQIVAHSGWRAVKSDLFLGRAVSRIAFRRAKAKSFLTAAELQAYYLRRPDAELKWKQP